MSVFLTEDELTALAVALTLHPELSEGSPLRPSFFSIECNLGT